MGMGCHETAGMPRLVLPLAGRDTQPAADDIRELQARGLAVLRPSRNNLRDAGRGRAVTCRGTRWPGKGPSIPVEAQRTASAVSGSAF